jgi:hypothetical protein
VPPIEQTGEPRAAPSKLDVQVRLERLRHSLERSHRDRLELAALHARHGLLRDARRRGDVGLSQPEFETNGPEGGAESNAIQAPMMAGRA